VLHHFTLYLYITFCVCWCYVLGWIRCLGWYSECASTPGKLKSLPDHGGNQSRSPSLRPLGRNVRLWDNPFRDLIGQILARIPGFQQRIILEPHVPSRGSQARRTRLGGNQTCALWDTSAMIYQQSYKVKSVQIGDISELSLVPSIPMIF
jgi:hypothetical protein